MHEHENSTNSTNYEWSFIIHEHENSTNSTNYEPLTIFS
jgi:hypothetical protein